MPRENPKLPWHRRFRSIFIGGALNPSDTSSFHKLSLIAFFAWVGLGSDGLSSSSYGPEEAFLALGHHHHLSILVALATAITVFIISASYSQIVEQFPEGGGGYVVASKLLSPKAGMVSGCALIIDYVLTITISIASAADAVFSFLPASYREWKLEFALLALVLLIVLNLRGARESVIPLVPVFLLFLLTHAFVILYGTWVHVLDFPAVAASTAADVKSTHSELGLIGMILLLLRSYSMGAGTYTGIEAVSNGMPILREPKVQTGKRTMLYMAVSLAFTVFGLMLCYLLYEVRHVPGKTLNAVLFESVTGNWPGAAAGTFVTVTLLSEALILFAAAQAGYLGGPRVLANMALDGWFPNQLSLLSERLVTQNGVLIMGGAAVVTLFLTKGSVKYLIVLYSITVFITFVLSQLGMVVYWWKNRDTLKHWKRRMAVNGTGLLLCIFILISMVILKFHDGGWITLIVTGALVAVALLVRRHYDNIKKLLRRMDNLVQAAQNSASGLARPGAERGEIKFDPKAKTAVMLVSGFNGVGLHTLFAIIRLFGGAYRNFVFLEIGLIDAGNFKGASEAERLKGHLREELDRYVDLMNRHGYYAEGQFVLSHDVASGAAEAAPRIIERFSQAVFFMGQLVFPEDTFLSRLLHNNAVFAVQRRLYHKGIPFIIMPVRVKFKV